MTAATKTSLTLPSVALPVRRMSSSPTSNIARRRPRPRSRISGDIGPFAGASRRPTDRADTATFVAAPTGSRTRRDAFGRGSPGARRVMPRTRRVVCVIESRTSATVSNVSGAGTAGRSASECARRRARVRGRPARASRAMPPTPSVTEWCTFIDERGAIAVEPFEQRELPQRPGAIERRGSRSDAARRAASPSRPVASAAGGARGSRGRRSARPPSGAARDATAATARVGATGE